MSFIRIRKKQNMSFIRIRIKNYLSLCDKCVALVYEFNRNRESIA